MFTYTAALRGARFRGGNAVNILRLLEPGDRIAIEPDFENPYDPNALKCVVNDEHVGYVAKEVAADIGPQMQENDNLAAVAFLLKHEADAKGNPNPLIYVCVMDTDEGEDEDMARAYYSDEAELYAPSED